MSTKTITTAEPSIAPPPMPIHLVDRADATKGEWIVLGAAERPQDRALCGMPWDRLNRSPDAPLCDGCADEFIRRHGFRHALDRRAS